MESSTWDASSDGLLRLPSGRIVRGRSLRKHLPDGAVPQFGVYLLEKPPPLLPWETRWVRWPDFRLPTDDDDARDALREVWSRASGERVEIGCAGGRGRTGTALACLAVIDGVPAADAVDFVRKGYHAHAVETPWQRRYVARFDPEH
jgi:hypothetical protein